MLRIGSIADFVIAEVMVDYRLLIEIGSVRRDVHHLRGLDRTGLKRARDKSSIELTLVIIFIVIAFVAFVVIVMLLALVIILLLVILTFLIVIVAVITASIATTTTATSSASTSSTATTVSSTSTRWQARIRLLSIE